MDCPHCTRLQAELDSAFVTLGEAYHALAEALRAELKASSAEHIASLERGITGRLKHSSQEE